jgi:hypothetical protein
MGVNAGALSITAPIASTKSVVLYNGDHTSAYLGLRIEPYGDPTVSGGLGLKAIAGSTAGWDGLGVYGHDSIEFRTQQASAARMTIDKNGKVSLSVGFTGEIRSYGNVILPGTYLALRDTFVPGSTGGVGIKPIGGSLDGLGVCGWSGITFYINGYSYDMSAGNFTATNTIFGGALNVGSSNQFTVSAAGAIVGASLVLNSSISGVTSLNMSGDLTIGGGILPSLKSTGTWAINTTPFTVPRGIYNVAVLAGANVEISLGGNQVQIYSQTTIVSDGSGAVTLYSFNGGNVYYQKY